MITTIDIGGTNIRMAYWKDGKMQKITKVKTEPKNWIKNVKEIAKFINEAPEQVKAIGVGMPGLADYKNGKFINPPNLRGWWNLDIKTELKNLTKISNIFFENDAKLMALANHKELGYTEKDITQFFTVSTGLGAGLIINDQIFQGSQGWAQEVAHLPVNTFSEKNSYSKGALEYFASGGGLAKRAEKYIGNISTKELFDMAKKGDACAKEIVDQGIESLANLIAIVGALINPTSVVFDGSVARYDTWYVERAFELSKERMYSLQGESIKMHISKLGDDSTLIGAYYLAKKMIGE